MSIFAKKFVTNDVHVHIDSDMKSINTIKIFILYRTDLARVSRKINKDLISLPSVKINRSSNLGKCIYQNIGNLLQGKSKSKIATKKRIKSKRKAGGKKSTSSVASPLTSTNSVRNSKKKRSNSRRRLTLSPKRYQIDDSHSESDDCEIIENVTPFIILDDDCADEPNSSTSASETSDTVTCSHNSSEVSDVTARTVNELNASNESYKPETEPIINSSSISHPVQQLLFYIDKNPCTNFEAPIYEVNECSTSNETVDMSSNVRNIRINGPVNFTNKENETSNITMFDPDPILSSTLINDSCDGRDDNANGSSNDETMNFHISINSTNETGSSRIVIASPKIRNKPEQTLKSIGNKKNIEKPKPIKRKAEQKADEEPALKKTLQHKHPIALNQPISKKTTDEVIVLNDTISDMEDDSVVFVSETVEKRNRDAIIGHANKHKALDYIPLNNESNNRKSQSTRAKRRREKKSDKMAMKQQQQQQRNNPQNRFQNRFDNRNTSTSFETYSSIVENSAPTRKCDNNTATNIKQTIQQDQEEQLLQDKPEQFEKRMIIIDGSNVARTHGLKNKSYSIKGIEICMKHFEDLGFEVKAFVPQMRLKRNQSTDPNALERLINAGKVISTPCKNLPGQRSTSYDDRMIMEAAKNFEAAIISNDNFNDLLNEEPEWRKIIMERVVGFSFCNDFIMIPKDPYGKNGRSLQLILHKLKSDANVHTQ